jgi:hypothetical protein
MVFGMVDTIVRSKGKRAAAMPGGYRGYLIMTPHDLFPSIAEHRVQTAPTAPVIPNPAMLLQQLMSLSSLAAMWGGMPPWMPSPQVAHTGGPAQGQAQHLDLLQQHPRRCLCHRPTRRRRWSSREAASTLRICLRVSLRVVAACCRPPGGPPRCPRRQHHHHRRHHHHHRQHDRSRPRRGPPHNPP